MVVVKIYNSEFFFYNNGDDGGYYRGCRAYNCDGGGDGDSADGEGFRNGDVVLQI